MPRICDWCRLTIAFLDGKICSGNTAWHTRCWNEAAEQRAAYIAEREDCEGFTFRPLPDELPTSETGPTRSEVFPIMATAAAPNTNTRAPREVVGFPPNVPVTVALKYGHAKTVSSQYGERFMFSLADGRVMFLAPEVGNRGPWNQRPGKHHHHPKMGRTPRWSPYLGGRAPRGRTTKRYFRGSGGAREAAGVGQRLNE